jgi:hypothetical protein
MIRVSWPMFLIKYVCDTIPVLGTCPKSHIVSEKDILPPDSSCVWTKEEKVARRMVSKTNPLFQISFLMEQLLEVIEKTKLRNTLFCYECKKSGVGNKRSMVGTH